MKIVILLEKHGGICNRLFQSIHFHASAIENKEIFFNPSSAGLLKFDNIFYYFSDKLNNIFLTLLGRLIFLFVKNNNFKITLWKNSYVKFVRGWDFRSYELTNKYYEEIKNIYQFQYSNLSKKSHFLKNYFEKIKRQGKFLVCFHIRKGDYKYWNKGKFYFSDDFYKKAIEKLSLKLIAEKKDPYIIAVSNEKINSNLGFDYLVNGRWKDDQIALQNCDLIVGPPSTFSLWASFISEIPLIQLNSIKRLKLESQKICKG